LKNRSKDMMTKATGNDHPRVVATINEAIDLAANDQISAAVEHLRPLVMEFPCAASLHGYLAWFLSRTGRHDEAIEHSRQAVGLSPTSKTASLVHFHVLWECGQMLAAHDEMKRFLAVRPSEEYTEISRQWDQGVVGHESWE